MESLEESRSILINAVTSRFQEYEEVVRREFEQREAASNHEKHQLENTIANLQPKVALLERFLQQNEWLRVKMEELKGTSNQEVCTKQLDVDDRCISRIAHGLSTPEHSQDGLRVIPYTDYESLVEKLHNEKRNCENLKNQCAYYKEACERIKAKYHENKSKIKSWQKYHDKMRKRYSSSHNNATDVSNSAAEVFTPSRVYFSSRPGSSSSARSGAATHLGKAAHALAERVVAAATQGAPLDMCSDLPSNIPQTITVRPTELDKPESSQSTEEEVYSNKCNEHTRQVSGLDLSSDPVFISSRPVKRRRREAKTSDCANVMANAEIHKEGDSLKPIRIKDENNNIVISLAAFPSLAHNNSIDLEEITDAIVTPRKKQRLERLISHGLSQQVGNACFQPRASSMPVELMRDHDFGNVFPEALHPKTSGPREMQGVPMHEHAERTDDKRDMYTYGEENQQSVEAQQGARDLDQTVLQPLSINRRLLRSSARKARSKSKCIKKSLDIEELAEDGEKYGRRRSTKMNGLTSQKWDGNEGTISSSIKGPRLNTLLNTPSPGREVLRPPTTSSRNSRSHAPNAIARTSPPGPTYQITNGVTDEIRPEDEPLRARPVKRLCLDDFKVNPKFNEGYDFAFSEVVRSREKRRCLPGCTRAECCGKKFEKMIELGGAAGCQPRGLWDSSQENGDDRLLEEYLGDNHSHILRMSASEKAETLLKARAQRLALKHGKHRQAFQRRTTPPGFWRTDMPTTQETEQDKARAHVMEREMVAERHAEAMRPNGRWTFRDE